MGADSLASTRPAGTSMQIASRGGRNCLRRRMVGGWEGRWRMATMPTESGVEVGGSEEGGLRREAIS